MSDSSWNAHDNPFPLEAEGFLNQTPDTPEYTLAQGASEIDDSADGGDESQPRRLGFTFRRRKKLLAVNRAADSETNPGPSTDGNGNGNGNGEETSARRGRWGGAGLSRQTRIGVAAVLSLVILVTVLAANKAGLFTKKTVGEVTAQADLNKGRETPPRPTPIARINADQTSPAETKKIETPPESPAAASATPPKHDVPTDTASQPAAANPQENTTKIDPQPTPLDTKDALAALNDSSIAFPDTDTDDTVKALPLDSQKEPLALAAAETEVTPRPKPADVPKLKEEKAPISPAPAAVVDLAAARTEAAEPPAQAPPDRVVPPSDMARAITETSPAAAAVEPPAPQSANEPPPPTQPSPATVIDPPATAAAETTPPASQPMPQVQPEPQGAPTAAVTEVPPSPSPAPTTAPATPDPAAEAPKPVDSPTPTFNPTETVGAAPLPPEPVKTADPAGGVTSIKIPSIGRNRMIDLDGRLSPEPRVAKEDPAYVDVTPSRSGAIKGSDPGTAAGTLTTTENDPRPAASMATPHTVQRGENLWTISRLYYGYGWFYKALWEANKETVAAVDKLYVGQTIRIPPPENLDRAYVENALKEFEAGRKTRALASSNQDISGTTTHTTPVNVSMRKASQSTNFESSKSRLESGELKVSLPTSDPLGHARSVFTEANGDDAEPARKRGPRYKIRPYETLRGIARDTLGDSRRSTEIYDMNQTVIDDPTHLIAGQIIELPSDARVGRTARRP